MKTTVEESELSDPEGKEASSVWSRYCWYFAASMAIVAVIYSGTELQALNRFGETFTSKLCDILPPPTPKYNVSNFTLRSLCMNKDFKNIEQLNLLMIQLYNL